MWVRSSSPFLGAMMRSMWADIPLSESFAFSKWQYCISHKISILLLLLATLRHHWGVERGAIPSLIREFLVQCNGARKKFPNKL